MNGKHIGIVVLLAALAYVAYRYFQSNNPTTATAQNNAASNTLPACTYNVGKIYCTPAGPVQDKPGVSVFCCTAAPNKSCQSAAYMSSNPCQTAHPGTSAAFGESSLPSCSLDSGLLVG